MSLNIKLASMIRSPFVDYPLEIKMGNFISDTGEAEYFMI